jgi:hypothetical protein
MMNAALESLAADAQFPAEERALYARLMAAQYDLDVFMSSGANPDDPEIQDAAQTLLENAQQALLAVIRILPDDTPPEVWEEFRRAMVSTAQAMQTIVERKIQMLMAERAGATIH